MKKRGPRRWRWVTRDYVDSDVEVWPGLKKPERKAQTTFNDLLWFGSGGATQIRPEEWKRLFGVFPPLNRPIKVEFSVKVVE